METEYLETSNKEFVKRLLLLAVPIMGQNLLMASVSFVDTLMIGMIGENALAAVGLANQIFFLITLFFFGVSSGSAIFIAQYWGAQDTKTMHKIMGIAVVLNLIGATFATLSTLFFPQQVMRIFTNDPVVIKLGSEYLIIVAISYLFTAIVMVYSTASRATGNAKIPLYMAFVSMLVNIVFNYVLILGKFGFPRLEVKGAALATAIARLVELCLLLTIIYKGKSAAASPIRQMLSFNSSLFKRFFKTCTPVILNEMFWALGMTAYKIAFAKMGVTVIASVNVTEAIQSLFFVALMGISNASAIMIGNRIGENKIDLASNYAKRLLIIGLLGGVVLGSLLALFSPYLPIPFNLTAQVAKMTTLSLLTLSLLVPIKAFNMVSIIGVLRSGGDTHFSMFAELVAVWVIGVPFAFFGAFVLKLPIHILYLFVGSEEAFKFIIGLLRIRSGKWINRLTEESVSI